MAIYAYNSTFDYGDIFKITDMIDKDGNVSYTTKAPISIKAVFKNDTMIWPRHNKYMFWASIDENEMDRRGDIQIIKVKAGRDNGANARPGGTQQVKIYVRSCSRFYRKKYPYRVILTDDWVSVQGQPSNERSFVIQPDDEKGTKENWDSILTVNVNPNSTRSERVTCITLYQVNSITGMPTMKEPIQKIYISQEADSIYGKATFEQGSAAIHFYADSTFSKETFNYGSENGNDGADVQNGTTKIYFRIVGYAYMYSGATGGEVYFGQNGEVVTDQFLTGANINKIYDITHLGNGKWSAMVSFNDNFPDASMLKPIIKDASLSPNEIGYVGGEVIVTFKLYNSGTAYSRSTNLKLTIPTPSDTDKYTGSCTIDDCVTLWQNGGEVTQPITDATPTVSLDVMSQFWITKVTEVLSEGNTYRQVWNVSEQQSKMSSIIEEVELYDSDGNVVTEFTSKEETNAKMRFTIMSNTESYESRKAVFHIQYNSKDEFLNFTQTKSDEGTWYKMTPVIRPQLITDGELMFTVPETNKFISNIRNLNYTGGKWQIQFNIDSNPSYNTPLRISTTSIPTYVSNEEHNENKNQVYVDFQVESGEVDSKRRTQEIDIVANSINCSEYVEVSQAGSSSATGTTYHDDCIGYVENVSDNLKTNFTSSTSSHTYHIPLKINENEMKSDEAAYMLPTRISNWSVGMLDNSNYSMVYIQVKGYMVAKGIERNVNFIIKLTSETCNDESFKVTQDATPTIFDKTKEIACTGLGIDDFTIEEGSEAEYIKNATPIYTSDGWYVLPLHVYENTTATSIGHRILINGSDMVNDTTTNKTYTISNWKSSTTLPLSCAWYQSGESISRKATISVRNEFKVEPIWDDVPFTKNLGLNWKYGQDWKCEVTKGTEWLSVSNYGVSITTSKNKSEDRRNGTLHFTFFDNDNNQIFEDNVTIWQECMNSIADLNLTFNLQQESIEVDEILGVLQSSTLSIESHDLDFVEYDVEYDVYEGLSITKEIVPGYGIRLTFLPTEHLYNISPKTWNVEVRQIDPYTNDATGNKVIIKITQPSYWLYATIGNNQTNIMLEYNDATNIQTMSYKEYANGTIEKADYTIMASDYGWISISDKTTPNEFTDIYVCKAYAMNISPLNYTSTITITQIESNRSINLNVGQYSWRDSEFDETWIDIYNVEDTIERNFWSQVNEQNTSIEEIDAIWDTEEDHSWCTISIEEDEEKTAKLVVSNNQLLKGDIPTSDVIKLRNSKYAIGSTRIIKHATTLSITSEDDYEADANTIVLYISPYKKDLWSNYYVTSTIDNIEEPYTITSDGNVTILKEGNVVKITPNSSNNTTNVIKCNGILKQERSNNTIKLLIKQLTKNQYEEVYY